MRCYNHKSSDAIGICKHCQKGLCKRCAVNTGGGLACKGICERTVIELNQMIEANLKNYQTAFKSIQAVPWTWILMGAGFFAFGFLTSISELKGFLFGFSAVCFISAWLSRRRKE
jgi:hypothetical protein